MKITTTSLIIIIGVIGFLGILITSISSEHFLLVFGNLFLLGIAFLMLGLLLGLLFGIPKSNNVDKSKSSILGNTNLEEVSDWLTKIIIGFGIAEISEIDESVLNLATTLNGIMPELPKLAILLVIIYFPIYGFISGWLLTRIYLTTIFAGVDQKLGNIFEKLSDSGKDAVDDNLTFDANNIDISTNLSTEEIIDGVNLLEEEGKEIDGDTYHKLGIILFSRRNYGVSAKYFERSFELTSNTKSLVNLGVIHNKGFNKPQKAIEIFNKVLDNEPNFPLALYNLACVQGRIGEKDEGMKNLESALRFGGTEYIKVANKDSALLPFTKLKKFRELLPNYDPRDDHNVG